MKTWLNQNEADNFFQNILKRIPYAFKYTLKSTKQGSKTKNN